MNAESTAILQDMISETKPEIQGGWYNPPLVVDVAKKFGSLMVISVLCDRAGLWAYRVPHHSQK